MTQLSKNFLVGLTVLVALVVLGILLLNFGVLPAKWFGPKRMPVQLHAPHANGISTGLTINYLGVSVGAISKVERSADQKEIILFADIDAINPPPANVIGKIRSQLIGGGSTLNLEIPIGAAPTGKLAANAVIETLFVGNELLPKEFADLATELRLTTEQVRKSNLAAHLDEAVVSLKEQSDKAGQLITSLDKTLNDPKLHDDLHASVANFRAATDSAAKVAANFEKVSAKIDGIADNANTTIKKTTGHIDDVAKNVNDRMMQVSRLLDNAQSIAAKIDQGKGTAGQLINDTKLYESLVNNSKELNVTITDLKLLVKQWTDEGVYIKLNK